LCLLYGCPSFGYFTVNSDGCFRANNCANTAARAASLDQFRRVVTLGSDAFGQCHNILRASADAQLTTLAKLLIDLNPSLWGHSFLLIGFRELGQKQYEYTILNSLSFSGKYFSSVNNHRVVIQNSSGYCYI
jgi:hypothetical protein